MNAMNDQLHEAEITFEMSQPEARLAEIAKMGALDYEKAREKLAEELGVRVSFLDKAIAGMRPKPDDEAEDPFEDVEPAADPVDGAALLAELQATILRFCILPEHSAPLMAAWIMHAWAHSAAEISPVLAITSPEKRCGKTTALSVVSILVPRPMDTVNISTSALFRVIEKHKPTVMLDEADTFLRDEKNGDMRGMLNGGHRRRTAYVWRSVGDDHEPRRFKVWAPKVIAAIGALPDTLEDRSLIVRLRRKREGETVERFKDRYERDLLPLRQKAARWAADNLITLENADPFVPDSLHDRAQDNARCICAIADVVGGHWPVTIRAALVGMHQEVEADEPQSAGVLLLRDVAEIFEAKRAERIGSTDLLNALCALEESPWSEWRGGRPISTRGIAKLLKPYGINPRRDRANNIYALIDFTDAFNRYLSKGAENTSTSSASSTTTTPSTRKHNKNNGGGACGTYGTCSEGGGSKPHIGAWEGEI